MIHHLTDGEYHCALMMATGRLQANIYSATKYERAMKTDKDDAIGVGLIGAMAEVAFAMATKTFMPMTFELKASEPDFVLPGGLKVDIKATNTPGHNLVAKKSTPRGQADVYVLAYVDEPERSVLFVGYATEDELLRPERIKPMPLNRDMYIMYRNELAPMSDLIQQTETQHEMEGIWP